MSLFIIDSKHRFGTECEKTLVTLNVLSESFLEKENILNCDFSKNCSGIPVIEKCKYIPG